MLESLNKQIVITIISLIFVITIFENTNLDMIFQSLFYNFEEKSWIISEEDTLLYTIFYSGFKNIFILFAIIILLTTIFINRIPLLKIYKKSLIILSLSLIFVPSLALLKNITNMPCPYSVIEFGGKYPNIKLFESYPKDLKPEKIQRCYPAGHATMGFSLMALYFFFFNPRNKKLALIFGISAGVLTGSYKMLIGDHFLSHTLVSMLLAWLVILIIIKITNKFL